MSLRVICPTCQHAMSIKQPKPGKFKPQCQSCKQSFRLQITADDPPQAIVEAIAAPTASPASTALKGSPASATDIHSQNTSASHQQPKTLEQSSIDQGINQTIEQVSNRPPVKVLPARSLTIPGNTEQTLVAEPKSNSSLAPDVTVSPSMLEVTNRTSSSQNNTEQTIEAPAHLTSNKHSNDFSFQSEQDKKSSLPASRPDGAHRASADNVLIERLGGYRIISQLGSGGMGAVYLAKQISLGRSVALKTIQAQWASNPRVIARFIREAYAAAQLTHHNVVQIYDLGEESGTNFFSMELVSGGSLEDLLKSKGQLPPRIASTMILQACRGLKFAHDHGMVHRDIKPANLMITTDGMIKIADLGLVKTPSPDDEEDMSTATPTATNEPQATLAAKQTELLASARSNVTSAGTTMGTPAYMSPEQADDASNVDHRADIYSLGCTYFALLTGRPPFTSPSAMEVLTKHKIEKLPRPETVVTGIPTQLGDIIEKMTAKDPLDRYADLADTIHDLQIYLGLMEGDYIAAEFAANQVKSALTIHDGPQKNQQTVQNESPQASKSEPHSSIPAPLLPTIATLGEQDATIEIPNKSLVSGSSSQSIEPSKPVTGKLVYSLSQSQIEVASEAIKEALRNPHALAQRFVPIGLTLFGLLLAFFTIRTSIAWSTGFILSILIGCLANMFFCRFKKISAPLAAKIEQAIRELPWSDRIMAIAACLLMLIATYYLGFLLPWIVMGLLGGAIGIAFSILVEQSLARARKPALTKWKSLLRELRMQGMDEDALRAILRKQFSSSSEMMFELTDVGADESYVHSIFQDPVRWARQKISRRIDTLLFAAKQRADQRVLTKIETARWMSTGLSRREARMRAAAGADALVEMAAQSHPQPSPSNTSTTQEGNSAGTVDKKQAAVEKKRRFQEMMAAARTIEVTKPASPLKTIFSTTKPFLGGPVRFLLGAGLLVGFALWVHQNQIFTNQSLQRLSTAANKTFDAASSKVLNTARVDATIGEAGSDAIMDQVTNTELANEATSLFSAKTTPLNIPLIGSFFDSWNPCLAGIMLVLSSLVGGIISPLLLCIGALTAWLGPNIGVPAILGLSAPLVCGLIGSAIGIAGMSLRFMKK